MLVAFWGPAQGQGRTTSNMAAVAATIALDHHIRVLMTHTDSGQGMLEYIFSQTRSLGQSVSSSGGLDAIQRLVQCGMLTPEGIRDHAESILKNRLELLRGSVSTEKHEPELLLPHIFKDYRRFYDLLFVEIATGEDPEVAQMVMKQADLIVVNLNQSQSSLNAYFTQKGRAPVPDNKPVLYCLGSYERKARFNKEKIMKLYGLHKNEVGFIPHHINYMDALNEQRIIPFLLKTREARKRLLDFNEDVYFNDAARQMGKLILQTLEIFPVVELDAAND
ncbi:hypothetical protein [Paenibacillus silagei]|uniref:ParA family protein n=1 Tax=Paenibacillus silagei TaxID=1670801 RepID=A0ABS4NPY6_9BACL|nr:hypothetical protein [Paenibacillus silagei]MBP2112126.1 hypothetical protein [Paenibacillus silagei]